jgi:hypothetical protein
LGRTRKPLGCKTALYAHSLIGSRFFTFSPFLLRSEKRPTQHEGNEPKGTEMSDELITPTEVAPEESAAEPEAVEPDSLSERQKALDARAAELDAWAKKVQKESSELGRARKQEVAAPKNDDDYEVSDEQVKMLKAMLRKAGVDTDKVANFTSVYETSLAEQLEDVTSAFFKEHKDIDQDQIVDKIVELGVDINGITPARAKKLMESAYKMVKAEGPDDMDARVAAAVEKRLAELAPKDGEEVIEIRPKKGSPLEGKKSLDDILDDPNISFAEKMLAAQ